jgi:hypothetical protein
MNPDPASLDRLHDIVTPPPVPWWPPAPGWYWFLGFLFVVAAILALRTFVRWQRDRYRREALVEWKREISLLDDATSRVAALTRLATLLKRAALSAFPRAEVASLTGPAWLVFLDRTAAMRGFSSETGMLLERAAYGSVSTLELDQKRAHDAASLVRQWLINHRAPNEPPVEC